VALYRKALKWHSAESYFNYNQSPSSIYLQSNTNCGMISGAFAQKCASAPLAQSHWTALYLLWYHRARNALIPTSNSLRSVGCIDALWPKTASTHAHSTCQTDLSHDGIQIHEPARWPMLTYIGTPWMVRESKSRQTFGIVIDSLTMQNTADSQ